MTDTASLQLEELKKLGEPVESTLFSEKKGMKVLSEKDFDTVFYSRTYPLISHKDRQIMNTKKVLFLGCSTNSPVATALLQQGLKQFILVDPDVIELSNTNRIIGAGITELGKNKALHLADYLANIHPYIKTTVYEQRLSDDELETVIEEADLIIEMVDDPASKIRTRTSAKKHNKIVLMITGIGDQPIVVVEKPEDRYFHRFTEEEVSQFMKPDLSIHERFRMYCTIIGPERIPPSVMVNMVLAATGKRTYIAQHGGTAMVAGGLGAYAARELLCGRSIQPEVAVSLPEQLSPLKDIEKRENELWKSLQTDYSDIFVDSDMSLRMALNRLARSLFDINY